MNDSKRGNSMNSMDDWGKHCRNKHASERRAHLNRLALRDTMIDLIVIPTIILSIVFIAYQIL